MDSRQRQMARWCAKRVGRSEKRKTSRNSKRGKNSKNNNVDSFYSFVRVHTQPQKWHFRQSMPTRPYGHLENIMAKTWNPDEVTVTRQLNNSVRIEKGVVYLLQLLSAIYEDPSRGKKDAKGKAKMAAPNMVRVLDLKDGREFDLMLNSVPHKRIEDAFPDGTHIGECVKLAKGDMAKGSNGSSYLTYDIDVIDGSKSPNYRDPALCKKQAGNYGPAEERKSAKGKG